MSDLKQARTMLRMAHKDLKALKGMMDTEIFEEEIFGFHAQQAIEKAFKAWLALLGHQYPLTHDISTLLELLESSGLDVERYWDLVEYNIFAVQFRYEVLDAFEVSPDRADTVHEIEYLIKHVEKQVKED